MATPLLSQRVGLLPLSTKCEAAGQSAPAARGVGGLGMRLLSWCWQSGQQAALATGEPHLGCVQGITITSKTASSYQQS